MHTKSPKLSWRKFYFYCLSLALVSASKDTREASEADTCTHNQSPTTHTDQAIIADDGFIPDQEAVKRMQNSCGLFLAQSTIPHGGLGLFLGRRLPRGAPVGPADIIIQLTDPNPIHGDGMHILVQDYAWDGQETGGQYEGKQVYSIIPGIGSLSNGLKTYSNVLPFGVEVDEANLPRTTAPGSGAISHYHNYSYFANKAVDAGGEIFVNYGGSWFEERERKGRLLPTKEDEVLASQMRSIDWLREFGICADNLYVEQSTKEGAGRGAFASRFIPRGAIIAPAPVIQITKRESLYTFLVKGDETKEDVEQGKQLLLNYMLGHKNSSILFYPNAPIVNLINHDAKNANAELRWSNSTQHRGHDWPTSMSIDEIRSLESTGLMLEYVATKDMSPGEEVFLNYGSDWQTAWENHVKSWTAPPFAEEYTPSYIMDEVASTIRTLKEQAQHPYPENIITSCFYSYGNNKGKEAASGSVESKSETTVVQWKLTRGLFELRNLRPCAILNRDSSKDGKHMMYTVQIRNRYGLVDDERVPRDNVHIVTKVPRQAIRFSDKIYTSDQHLPKVFRHEIGIPDEIFPPQWMDRA